MLSKSKRIGLLGMFFLLLGCDGLLERTVVCFPQKGHDGKPEDFALTARDLYFETKDRVRLHGWLFSADPQGLFLLWCHGNAGNISHRLENIALLTAQGINVFIFDYRGYGKSQGTLSEQGFYLDS
ncbi:MAG: alpha/beta hydrolase, partial [Deltaproteobacteria bacterium]|nr:alpha/beta hydrolase [Deltaproteobacteria bacterium]